MIIYDEKIVGEERSDNSALLWHLADELYPSVTAKVRDEYKNAHTKRLTDPDYTIIRDDSMDIYLIKLLLQEYYENS